MNEDVTQTLVEEHRLILRMIELLERNARRTADGSFSDWQFYLDAVDFIRNFADRFHHAKEEDVLFAALVRNGMPAQHSPVAAMLMEHEEGRRFVRELDGAARAALAGTVGQEPEIAANALAYAQLLREHIAKEDGILYPLAERVLPAAMRTEIRQGYGRAEAGASAGLMERYRTLVEKYENKG